MEESKKAQKNSWISYWLIALCVFMLLQAFVFPNLFKGDASKEVGYDTFHQHDRKQKRSALSRSKAVRSRSPTKTKSRCTRPAP